MHQYKERWTSGFLFDILFTKSIKEQFMNIDSGDLCEHMTRQESDILYDIYRTQFINQRMLAESSGYSIGVVNRTLRSLNDSGYLDKNNRLTKKAFDLIDTCVPGNAIILEAGLGMRMVPINLTTPKAMLEVNGQRLIDRLIEQLHDAGIRNITVVVGFMKDSFEYLIDEYGVRLVYAADYAVKNNIHSLKVALNEIENTYIVPCDIWCETNPFRDHEMYSWYMVSDAVGTDSDVRVNRKMELVRVPADTNGNKMIGISYLTGDEAKTVKKRIREFAGNSRYNDKFWEEALYTDDRMIVQARIVSSSGVVEINTFEQLNDINSDSNQLGADALDTICRVMDCRKNDVVDIELLKKGMTNRSFLFRVKNGKNTGRYIIRIPGEGTEQLIDRTAEAAVYEIISGCRFCDMPVYIDPQTGIKISGYIDDAHCCDPYSEEDIIKCMGKLRQFHDYRIDGHPLAVSHTFDLFERIDFYESLWNGNRSIYVDYEKTKRNCKRLCGFIEKHRGNMQLTHIDAVPDNFLFDPNANDEMSIQLIDWEYAAMQDKHVDIAMFAIYSLYDKQQIDKLIDLYFEEEGGCDEVTRTKIYCYISVCGLIWSNWCEYKRNLGVEFGEYSLYQYRYSKDYFRYAAEKMKEIGEPLDQ